MSADVTAHGSDDGAACVYPGPHPRHGSCPGIHPDDPQLCGADRPFTRGEARCVLEPGGHVWHQDQSGITWHSSLSTELAAAAEPSTVERCAASQRVLDQAAAGAALYWALYFAPKDFWLQMRAAPKGVIDAYMQASAVFGTARCLPQLRDDGTVHDGGTP